LGPVGQLGQAAADDLLVDLGELAADHRLPVRAVRGRELGQRGRETPAGLEVDLGAPIFGQFGETPLALARPPGREPLEAEPVGRQPGHGQRGRHRRRPGQRGHRDPGRRRGGDDPVAGIADPRSSRVRDQQHVLPGRQLGQQPRGAARLHCVVIRDQPRPQFDAEAGREPAYAAGVLGRDDGGPAQLGRQPGRRVLGPADRNRGQRQHPGSSRVALGHGGILHHDLVAGLSYRQ